MQLNQCCQLHFHIINQHLYVLLQLIHILYIYTLLLDHFVSKVQKLTPGFFNSSLKCLRKRSPAPDFLNHQQYHQISYPPIPKLCRCPDLHHSLCHGTWCRWTSETHVSFTVPWLPKNVVSRCFTLHSWKQTPKLTPKLFSVFFVCCEFSGDPSKNETKRIWFLNVMAIAVNYPRFNCGFIMYRSSPIFRNCQVVWIWSKEV